MSTPYRKNALFGRYTLWSLLIYMVVLGIGYGIIERYVTGLRTELYREHAHQIKSQVQLYIDAKAESVFQLALALSGDESIKQALLSGHTEQIDLQPMASMLREQTPLKYLWMQVIDRNGVSVYRSWTHKTGDNLLSFRSDLAAMLQSGKAQSSISVGLFDMTFKSTVPIYHEGKLIGMFEIVSKFNSVAEKVAAQGVMPIFLADKRYYEQIRFPFSKLFVGGYYVVNLNASHPHLDYLRSIDYEKLLADQRLFVDLPKRRELLALHHMDDPGGGPMAHFLLFIPYDQLDFSRIEKRRRDLLITITIFYWMVAMLGFALYTRRQSRHIEQFNEALSLQVEEKTRALDRQHRFLQEVIDGVSESVMVIDATYNVVLMNKVAKEHYDADFIADPHLPKCYEVSHHRTTPCDGLAHPCPLHEVLHNRVGSTVLHEHRVRGGTHYYELTATPLFDEHGAVRAIIEVGHDVTSHLMAQNQLREQKESLDYMAHHDPLTALPNRALLMDRLEHAILRAQRDQSCVSVLFLDLDRFKQINDSLGHGAGDELLVQVANRLGHCVRSVDTVARLGGDEFTILLEACSSQNDVIDIVEKLLEQVASPIFYRDQVLYTSASVGISIYPYDGLSAEELLRNADAAMYRAKEEGRNTYQFYTADMTERAMERVVMESAMRKGLQNDEFFLEYQPQYDCRDNTLIGMEALVRWMHPKLGRISPAQFIPLAEETGLIVPLGERVLELSAAQAALWRSQELNPGRIAVNLSVKQLRQKNLLESIRTIIKERFCSPEWIELEVTEGYVMEHPDEAINRLREIRSTGISLAMDDFGTGYSSLSLLKRLPIHKLKIDASFIRDIPGDEEDEAITCTIIDLARHMHLEVIAEGVETLRQKEFLLTHGCNKIQGFLYAKPQSAEQITLLLRSKP
ncbi:MAG: EAL domain-containing protein [Campylobacterales bacterium]|nr:EAL domain-containing protein [Campylobacterales bacterium]